MTWWPSSVLSLFLLGVACQSAVLIAVLRAVVDAAGVAHDSVPLNALAFAVGVVVVHLNMRWFCPRFAAYCREWRP